MKNFYSRGVTIMEVLIVFAVLALMVAVVLSQFSKIRERQVLKAASSETLSAISKARGKTLASVNSSEYGIYFDSDEVVIFRGTIYSAGAADNEVINIFTPASITNVTLNGTSGGSGQLYFSRIYGAPSKTGTITISTSSESKIITIGATGVASMN